jgi:hypothetical protein
MSARVKPNKLAVRNYCGAALALWALIAWACRGTPPAATVAPKPVKPQSLEEPSHQLPADFSRAIPVYPSAKIASVRRPKGAMREIFFLADGKLDPMIEYYKAGLDQGGYQITATLKMAARKTWSCDFHKGGQQASVMIFPNEKDNSLMTIDLIYEIPSTATAAADPSFEDFDVIGPGEVAQSAPNQSEKRN